MTRLNYYIELSLVKLSWHTSLHILLKFNILRYHEQISSGNKCQISSKRWQILPNCLYSIHKAMGIGRLVQHTLIIIPPLFVLFVFYSTSNFTHFDLIQSCGWGKRMEKHLIILKQNMAFSVSEFMQLQWRQTKWLDFSIPNHLATVFWDNLPLQDVQGVINKSENFSGKMISMQRISK